MESLDGIVRLDFISSDGKNVGSQFGLMMTVHHQTMILTPFDISKNHFTHAPNAMINYKGKHIMLNKSRYSYFFFIRVFDCIETGVNPISEFKINFPSKNHFISDGNKIDSIDNIEYNGWHASLPQLFFQQINNKKIELGSITFHKEKITGMIVKHFHIDKEIHSIVVGMYFLKQILNTNDTNISFVYYGLNVGKNTFYVDEDYDLYTDKLKNGDIILSINDVPFNYGMYYDKFDKLLKMETWITLNFLDNTELRYKIIRKGKQQIITIPRIPIMNILQFKFYSDNPNEITFEKMHTNCDDRVKEIGMELCKNPKKLFM